MDIEIGGWDISNKNLFDSCKRAGVLEPDLVNKLQEHLTPIVPWPAAFNPEFVAANQSDRVDNVLVGTNNYEKTFRDSRPKLNRS